MTTRADWAEAKEQQVLDAALRHAPAEGWTQRMAYIAGREAGLSRGDVELLLPRGPADLAALLSRRHDQAGLSALSALDPASLKIRERIAKAVSARIEAAMADEAALKRWAGFLALPLNQPLALRLLWEGADVLWRWAGDTATDENHYSKRAILAGILAGALAVRLASGVEAQEAFTAARIENVMAYERWKAKVKPIDVLTELAANLGRLRYAARP